MFQRALSISAATPARSPKKAYCTAGTVRQLFGSTHANPASRFLHEIPESLRRTTGVGAAGFSGSGGAAESGEEEGEALCVRRTNCLRLWPKPCAS